MDYKVIIKNDELDKELERLYYSINQEGKEVLPDAFYRKLYQIELKLNEWLMSYKTSYYYSFDHQDNSLKIQLNYLDTKLSTHNYITITYRKDNKIIYDINIIVVKK